MAANNLPYPSFSKLDTMGRIAGMLVALCCLLSCADHLIDQIPTIPVTPLQDLSNEVYTDSLLLNKGLISRKLKERGFTHIYGLARFHVEDVPTSFDYDLVLISCRKGPQSIHLLTTIHKTFNSATDIFRVDPTDFKLSGVFANERDASYPITIELVSAVRGSDAVILMVDLEGKISKFAQ